MKILAIDGNSIISRAFYGIRPLTTAEGVHTNAVYGFLSTYLKTCEEESPDAAVVCWDLKSPDLPPHGVFRLQSRSASHAAGAAVADPAHEGHPARDGRHVLRAGGL